MDYFRNFNRLEFVITYLCTSKCRHCFVSEERKKKYPGFLSKDLAVNIIKSLAGKYKIDSVMTFGGEPMIFPETTLAIHETAKEIGIPKRQIITNGFWSNDFERIGSLAKKIAESGVNEISFSVDCFHNEHIPIEIVKKTAEELLAAGIVNVKWNPCWVKSSEDNNEYNRKTRDLLEKLNYLDIKIARGNVMDARGNAQKEFKKYLPKKSINSDWKCGDEPYTDRPDNVTGICIEPNGELNICPNFKANCQEKDVLNILARYNPYKDEIAKIILEDGMSGLIKYCKKNKIEIPKQGYYSVCDMCQKINKNIKGSNIL